MGILHIKRKVLNITNFSTISSLNLAKLNYNITQSFTPLHIKFFESTTTKNYRIENSFLEFLVKDSFEEEVEYVGGGNSPIDLLIKEKGIGIDVAFLCLNGKETNEKSLMQNFKSSGENLDTLFKNKEYNNINNLFRKDYINKHLNAQEKYNIDKIYYMIFISAKNKIYITLLQSDLSAVINVEPKLHNTKNSVFCNNFISEKYGNVKIYKSKKRIELRLKKEIINHPYVVKLFDSTS